MSVGENAGGTDILRGLLGCNVCWGLFLILRYEIKNVGKCLKMSVDGHFNFRGVICGILFEGGL